MSSIPTHSEYHQRELYRFDGILRYAAGIAVNTHSDSVKPGSGVRTSDHYTGQKTIGIGYPESTGEAGSTDTEIKAATYRISRNTASPPDGADGSITCVFKTDVHEKPGLTGIYIRVDTPHDVSVISSREDKRILGYWGVELLLPHDLAAALQAHLETPDGQLRPEAARQLMDIFDACGAMVHGDKWFELPGIELTRHVTEAAVGPALRQWNPTKRTNVQIATGTKEVDSHKNVVVKPAYRKYGINLLPHVKLSA